MGKPYGIDALFSHVIIPTTAENAVWDAVSEAFAAGWTFERLKRELADAWRHAASEKAKEAAK